MKLKSVRTLALTSLAAIFSIPSLNAADTETDQPTAKQVDGYLNDGRWLGPGWWGNRLQDWTITGSKYTCKPNKPFLGWRVAHDTTRNLDASTADLSLSVDVVMSSAVEAGTKLAPDALSGILLGSGHSIKDPMARLLMFDYATKKNGHHPSVPGSGYAIGFSGDGSLRIIDFDAGKVLANADQDIESNVKATLKITTAKDGENIKLTATSGSLKVEASIPRSRYQGGLGLISHSGTRQKGVWTLQSEFSNYIVQGGHQRALSQAVGPVVCAQYTVDRGVLKLTAQFMTQPKGSKATLEFMRDGKWTPHGDAVIHETDQQARFRVEQWDNSKEVPYRVILKIPNSPGHFQYSGTIAAEPKSDTVRLAALGCIIHRPWGKVSNWNDVLYYPHHDLQKRVMEKKPDVVFFYGDQMYENTPSSVDRQNYFEDYLYKWLFHCVAFRETFRHVPSVTIPDDHDVYQGNHWGEGARHAPKNNPNMGGYAHPGAFVAQVHRTQTSHLPDAYEPDCLQQNIPAYHCDWNYGGISFAILGDRYFKSGPAGHGLPKSGTNRPDHYNNPDFDTAKLDLPGLQLLGEPQELFLAHWAADWSHGAKMKALLSQSPFGNLATHHAGRYLIADLDSNGWPQSGRKRALKILRAARAVHIAGDQHLSTMIKHGIDEHDDAIYSFCAPATANAYARAYHPSYKGSYYKTTPPKPEQYLGKRLDGFKNKVTFLAVANPDIRPNGLYTTKSQPRLHQQVPGFGIIDFNTAERTITFHSLPRSEEVAQRLKGGEYPGWPITVSADQNDGRKPVGILTEIEAAAGALPAVRVYNPDGTLQWAQRMKSNKFSIPAYAKGKHKIEVSDGKGNWKTIEAEPK